MPSRGGLKKQALSLPDAPGVYLIKDGSGAIIYVGKAKSLKKRVRSYFRHGLSGKPQAMIYKAAGIDYISARSEAKAEILEAKLIKEIQPVYNVSLKDDKSFPLLRLSCDKFPIVSICRLRKATAEDGASYFGPYTSADSLRRAFKLMRRVFGFRTCKKMPHQPCLYYPLGLCPAPCAAKINAKKYGQIIKHIKMFLEHKHEELLSELSRKMKSAARGKKFEEAARLRDQVKALSVISEGKIDISVADQLEQLRCIAGLKSRPFRIEAFDISNISGDSATGSLVSFYNGIPDKANYRRFRIRSCVGIDDYAMLREVLLRRYSRRIREKLSLPDLVLVDGGRAHLSTAKKTIRELGLNLAVIAIAKENEDIYINEFSRPLSLDSSMPAFNLIIRLRDEAHRFALNYHRLLRKKKILGK